MEYLNELAKTILDNGISGEIFFDIDSGKIIYANKKAVLVLGYSLSNLLDIIPEWKAIFTNSLPVDNMHELYESNEKYILSAMCFDGTQKLVCGVFSILPDGKTVQFSFNEQKEIEETEDIANDLSFIKSIYKTVECGIIYYSADGKFDFISANLGASKMLGFESLEKYHEVMNRDGFDSLIHPDDSDRIIDKLNSLANSDKPIEFKHRVYCQAGYYLWVLGSARAINLPKYGKVFQSTFIDITQQVEEQSILNMSHHRLEKAIDMLGIEIWEYNSDEDTFVFNLPANSAEKIMARKVYNAVERNIESAEVLEESVADYRALHKKMAEGADTATADIYVNVDGERHCKRVIYQRAQDVTSGRVAIIGTSEDITHFKNVEGNYGLGLAHTPLQKDLLISAAKIDISRKKIELLYDYYKDTSVTAEEDVDYDVFLASLCARAEIPHERERICSMFSASNLIFLYENGKDEVSMEYRCIIESAVKWVRIQCKLIRSPKGNIVAYINETDVDEELKHLAVSDNLLNKLSIIVGDVYAMVASLDYENGTYDTIHETQHTLPISGKISEMCRKFQYVSDPKSRKYFDIIADKDKLSEYIRLSSTNALVFEVNTNIFREEQDWYEHKVMRAFNDNDDLYIFMTSNINDRKHREYELEIALEAAENAIQAKQNFLSHMSHEIRTPLNGIIGMLDLLGNDTVFQDNRYLKNASIASKHLLHLINDILDMSKIENGKIKLRKDYFAYTELYDYLVAVIQPMADEKQIKFQICDRNKVFVYKYIQTDTGRFKQIMINILSNAIKYTPEGGNVRFDVVDRCVGKNAIECELIVEDNGIGMSEEYLSQIFEPFSQEEKYKSAIGTGLGLTITKLLVDAMGYNIHFDSKEGKGTKVTVSFAANGYNTEDLEGTDAIVKHGELENLGVLLQKRILLVEDNEINKEIAVLQLESLGVVVDTACDGFEAVDTFAQSPVGYYDVVLMDIMMPRMDGITATRKIRSLEREDSVNVPMVAMTADAFAEDLRRYQRSGLDFLLPKPYDKNDLIKVLLDALK